MSVSIGWKSRESLARSEFRICVAWLGIGFSGVFCVVSRILSYWVCKHEISLLESCLDSKVLDTSPKGSAWQMEVEFMFSFSLYCVACEVLLLDSVLFWFGL